ncbi:DUF6300 family protein [Actinomadura sp. ATCC 31491]|uniref:DUF6300 family protein n=1 Tax=Actinomadura luzonensis TaxID=2805427 RepID=A0ABT0G477_9ACTN|nr:DUF6300 family protein [Actinomadura luzonensis]
MARVPHGWANAAGAWVRGTAEVVLCGRCDAADPAAAFLLGAVTPAAAGEAARLLRGWLGRAAPPPGPDEDVLRAEAEAWRRGDL